MAAFLKKGRVLVLVTSKEDYRPLRRLLRLDFELQFVYNAQALFTEKNNFDPQVIVFADMPESKVIVKVRAMDSIGSEHTGIILLTSIADIDSLQHGVKCGVDSFCNWELIQHQLAPSVELTLRLNQLTSEQKDNTEKLRIANQELKMLATTDDLTGLYNMRYINERLGDEFLKASRYSRPLSIIMIDIDRFKEVNDKADHLLGSFVIGEVGREIRKVIRTTDVAGRYGGDEFIIVLPETDVDGAFSVCQRLHSLIDERVYDNGIDKTKITISQGYAAISPNQHEQAKTFTDLLRMADSALFQAKDSGRNAIMRFEEGSLRRRSKSQGTKKKVQKKAS